MKRKVKEKEKKDRESGTSAQGAREEKEKNDKRRTPMKTAKVAIIQVKKRTLRNGGEREKREDEKSSGQ